MPTHFEIEPIGRLWRLALPLIIANISTPILGLADAAISGHLDHAYYLAAVTVGAELLVVFFGAFSFLRMGTTGMVAQAVGADDHNLSFSILSHAIALAAIIGIWLFVLGSQAITPILELAKVPAEMHRPLEEYLETRLWGTPANLTLLALTGWFIGKGHTQITLYLAISINLLNICLNYTLAIGYQMNSFGIALGTVISEYVGLIIAFTILVRDLGNAKRPLKQPWQPTLVIKLVKVNLPLMIRTIALHGVFVTLSIFAARLGTVEAASIGLILVLLATAAYALDGFAYAAEIEAGQSFGGRHFDRFIDSLKGGAVLSGASALIIVSTFTIFQSQIFAALTDFNAVIEQASDLMVWFTGIVLVLCWSYWLDGVFIGLTKTLDMCFTMCFSVGFGWVGGIWAFGSTSLDSLMSAFLMFCMLRTLSLALRLPTVVRQVKFRSDQNHLKS
jgi:MATE family multidrug resistance protein